MLGQNYNYLPKSIGNLSQNKYKAVLEAAALKLFLPLRNVLNYVACAVMIQCEYNKKIKFLLEKNVFC